MSFAFFNDDRLFGRDTGIHHDASAGIARDAVNVATANYTLAQLHGVGSVRPQHKFAINNHLFFNGAAAGIGPNNVKADSALRSGGLGDNNAKDIRMQPVATRQFLCTPNIRKGSINPDLESRLRSGIRVGFEPKSQTQVTESDYIFSQPPIDESRFRPMESQVVDGWVIGGINTRAARDNL